MFMKRIRNRISCKKDETSSIISNYDPLDKIEPAPVKGKLLSFAEFKNRKLKLK